MVLPLNAAAKLWPGLWIKFRDTGLEQNGTKKSDLSLAVPLPPRTRTAKSRYMPATENSARSTVNTYEGRQDGKVTKSAGTPVVRSCGSALLGPLGDISRTGYMPTAAPVAIRLTETRTLPPAPLLNPISQQLLTTCNV